MANKGDKSVGLIDGVPKEEKSRRSETMAASSSPGRIWVYVCALFFIASSLALAGYIIYLKAFVKPTRPAMTEAEIVKRFPLLFRTPEEQITFEAQFLDQNREQNLEIANKVTDLSPVYCSFDCPSNLELAKRKRSIKGHRPLMEWIVAYKTVHAMYKRDVSTTLIYHGCCISHAANCQGCGCAQETNVMTAVVVNTKNPDDSDEPYVLAAIKIPGCCKCFNNLKAP